MNRRTFMLGTALAGGLGLVGAAFGFRRIAAATSTFEIEKTEAEWRSTLTPEQFAVLRQHATEQPFASPLNDEHRKGTFACAGCDLPLYSSGTKFDSGTGWPSFYQPLPNAVGTSEDRSWFLTRTESIAGVAAA